jgi:hypothetical protein
VSEDADSSSGRARRWLATGGVLVSVLAAAVGLLFTLEPGLKPCLGDTRAEFTGAPVFPHVRFRDHLVRTGARRDEAAKEPNLVGAEIRFSFATTGLRDEELTVTWSLVAVERDGTLGPVVAGQDRALAMTVVPDACSQAGGKDLFVQIPDPRQRYRVVLELYRTPQLRDRLALMETDPFRG